MSASAVELIADEMELLRRVLPLARTRVVDLGCGNGQMTRRFLEEAGAAAAAGLEVDERQHAKNLAAPPLAGLSFVMAGADDIPFPDGSFDVATMFKSLHHVPLARLDRALAEIRRVLVPGGLLYVSEPVAEGPFNEIVRLFHDEAHVRGEALAALRRAQDQGVLEAAGEVHFDAPLAFRDFDAFYDRIVRVTHSELVCEGETLAEVKRRFARHATAEGARFVRPMRVNLLRRPR